jgi:hypothetical protein
VVSAIGEQQALPPGSTAAQPGEERSHGVWGPITVLSGSELLPGPRLWSPE